MVRLGKHDINILKQIDKSSDGYFSISKFSRDFRVSKGAIKPALERLMKNRLISKVQDRVYSVLDEGKYIIRTNCKENGSRSVVRKREFKSIHTIKVYIESEIKSIKLLIEQLKPYKYFASHPKNWTQHNLEFEDGTRIEIKPHLVVLNIHECIGKTWEEADNRVRDEVFRWLNILNNKGVTTDNVYVNYAHFAKVNSVFAKEIEKRLGQYKEKLSSGKSFWIDYSTGELEEETDSPQLRDNIKNFMDELEDGRKLSDIDNLKDRLLKIESIIEKLTISHKRTTENLESQTKILELSSKMPQETKGVSRLEYVG